MNFCNFDADSKSAKIPNSLYGGGCKKHEHLATVSADLL